MKFKKRGIERHKYQIALLKMGKRILKKEQEKKYGKSGMICFTHFPGWEY
jgi:hypothetical protein